ncbi:MAG: DUF2079 domain-containing protein [Clostridiales bacterium]|nr:DUF2079 domain-containing protein [Clostridiales bacterium]
MRLLGVYFLLSDVMILWAASRGISARNNWKDYILLFPFPLVVIVFLLLFAEVTLLYYFLSPLRKALGEVLDPAILIIGAMFFSCILVWRADDFRLSVILGLFAMVFVVYGGSRLSGKRLLSEARPYVTASLVAAASIAVFLFICQTALAIHRTYGTSTFDMGIFEQMYYNMSHGFRAVTTCERGYALSHFRVHSSFILYLLLPFYALVPGAETLIVLQALIVVSGVIPVYLISKKRGFAGTALFCSCMLYLFSLGILSPCYFHFHENAFLPPLLLWLLYASETKKNILFYVMSALICIVKEDATLFVMCVCLYLAFEEKGNDRRKAWITGCAALLYFLVAGALLARSGDGEMIMSSRMHTMMIDKNQSATEVLRNILLNPGHALDLFVSEKNAFVIFLEMMIPLLFLPFVTRKIHRLFLMVPFCTFNLLIGSAYTYASQIQYHYAFGTATLLIYLALINLSDLDKEKRNLITVAAGVVSVITAISLISPNLSTYERYTKNKAKYQQIEDCLEKIPADASVTSADKYLPHLARREEIYALMDESFVVSGNVVMQLKVEETDFFVLDLREDRQVRSCEILKSRGYEEYARCEDELVIFVRSA